MLQQKRTKNLIEHDKKIKERRWRKMKALEKVKDALKRKSKGQNVMVGLAIATISSVIFAIIVVYIISQIYSLMPPNTPFTTAMNHIFLLLIVAIAAPPSIVFLLLRRL